MNRHDFLRCRVLKIPAAFAMISAILALTVWGVAAETNPPEPAPDGSAVGSAAQATDIASPDHRVAAYYFHPTLRCESCLRLEAYSHATVLCAFPEAVATGRLDWQVFDFEDPDNLPLAGQFAIEGSTVTIIEFRGDEVQRWKHLDDAWYLLEDAAELLPYVQRETRAYLEGN